jgi:hypothetical protein
MSCGGSATPVVAKGAQLPGSTNFQKNGFDTRSGRPRYDGGRAFEAHRLGAAEFGHNQQQVT